MAMLFVHWVARLIMLDTTEVRTNMLDNTWVTPAGLSKATCLSGSCLVVLCGVAWVVVGCGRPLVPFEFIM